ncbi:hypothetical protein [uncultured Draconibacterium sp.]|uniref:hypothetical protein n=1 Tax=uncultured Draconibacterium sp. TaxID=1573823 RepID=UPI0025D41D0E|nr:hypothetical protein [uncultured Draconibacterium sp.]
MKDRDNINSTNPAHGVKSKAAEYSIQLFKMKKHFLKLVLLLMVLSVISNAQQVGNKYGTVTEKTPSIPQYFSWLSHMNEGMEEAQIMSQLEFFKWLHDEYGMNLEIYALDAGMIDTYKKYGTMDSPEFKKKFPNGWDGFAELADSFSCKLGLWGGPDGFGNTEEEENARIELMSGLCRDYGLQLFKFDAVCGQLRDEKQASFAKMLTECRKYVPNLIALNHRLNLGIAKPHVTTSLWEHKEMYVDVQITNNVTGTHNRVGALSRGLPPGLTRLIEDHGCCISSCLDYWEDELIIQAFNRSLILAPEIYGNPWLLRDDEYAKLGRIYNLHYRNREILVDGIVLPSEKYGVNAVSRGDGSTRFITLRNLSWNPETITVALDNEIGLTGKGNIEVRRYHPSEKIIGEFKYGEQFKVEVEPFRSCLLMVSTKPSNEIGIKGCNYEVVRDTKDKPVLIKLLGMPGSNASISLDSGNREFSKAYLDGKSADKILDDNLKISFSGKAYKNKWHRKLGDLEVIDVPDDAKQLYEATCFTASNNIVEAQSLKRSGETNIPQVKKARDTFFENEYFIRRGLWDKFMFDGDLNTFFGVYRYSSDQEKDKRIDGGALRLDLGKIESVDKIVMSSLYPVDRENLPPDHLTAEVSTDLKSWKEITLKRAEKRGKQIDVSYFMQDGSYELFDTDVYDWTFDSKEELDIRYIKIKDAPDRIAEFKIQDNNQQLSSSIWQATHLFAPYDRVVPIKAWETNVKIDKDAPEGSYLCVAFEGTHGVNKAFSALRMDGKPIGSPLRAPSFPFIVRGMGPEEVDKNNTYYFPISDEMKGKKVDVVGLLLKGGETDVKPHVWTTCYPTPYEIRELRLEE